ncbi:hypothetical protein BKA70DRAFT_1154347 [Coprinopsis sp. MPI-PUGE-AT-0042]|nr:hypothetical protein BKA70DRAFT_1154347 [Coprinopsis sp. MPI-PUGE-AT-0042]
MVAVSDALRLATGSNRLQIHTSSRSLIDNLTKKVGHSEDRAWTTHKHGEMLEALVSRLRRRDGYTTFKLTDKKQPTEEMKRAIRLAEEAENEPETNTQITLYTLSCIRGARLEALSQADMYKLILSRRRPGLNPRRHTAQNMEATRENVRVRTGKKPDLESVWTSYKTKAVQSKKAKALLWKIMHGALPVGEMWNRGGGNEEKATCPMCRTIESTEHIFLKCKGNGQAIVWKEARDLLRKAEINLPQEIDVPTILGSAMSDLQTEGRPDAGRNRLYTKTIIESMYLIWVMRCKWKIGDKGDEQKAISAPEARNRWKAMMNKALLTEVVSTSRKRYGNKALDKETVLETWQRVVIDADALRREIDSGWSTGVVVGIG